MADNSNVQNEIQVRTLVENWGKAVRAKDIRGIVAHHADDIVLFDVPQPVQSRGIDAYRKSWQDQFLPWFGDSGVFEIDELQITAGDHVAFCHGVIRCAGTLPSGQRTEVLVVRLTVGLMKIDSAWTVIHEHHSEPSS